MGYRSGLMQQFLAIVGYGNLPAGRSSIWPVIYLKIVVEVGGRFLPFGLEHG